MDPTEPIQPAGHPQADGASLSRPDLQNSKRVNRGVIRIFIAALAVVALMAVALLAVFQQTR